MEEDGRTVLNGLVMRTSQCQHIKRTFKYRHYDKQKWSSKIFKKAYGYKTTVTVCATVQLTQEGPFCSLLMDQHTWLPPEHFDETKQQHISQKYSFIIIIFHNLKTSFLILRREYSNFQTMSNPEKYWKQYLSNLNFAVKNM